MTEFEQIYQAYFQDVYLYVRRLSGGNDSVAEEITSETFFKAMSAIDCFRGDCEVRVWLCQIAKNCYFSYLKEQKKGRTASLDDLADCPSEAPPLEEQLFRQEQAHTLQALLHQLDEPYKEVFLWRVYGQLPFREIGALFQKSENWACVTYHRAKSMLRKGLEESDHEK